MVEFEYYGGNAIVISSSNQKLIIDPRRSVFGLDDLSVEGGVEIDTETRLSSRQISDAFLQIDGPGEYEVADFSIRGFSANRQTDFNNELSVTNYAINVEGINIIVIGNISNDLSEPQLEELGVADILVIPVGGNGYTLDGKIAGDITVKIDPKVVIPVHYADSRLKYEVPQDGFEVFSNELGAPVSESDKYKVRRVENLPSSLEIIKLKLRTKK